MKLATLETLIIVPELRLNICGRTACISCIGALASTSINWISSARLLARKLSFIPNPALLIKTSIGFLGFESRFITFANCTGRERSACRTSTSILYFFESEFARSCSRFLSRATRTKSKPSLASNLVKDSPIPAVAPVTSAVAIELFYNPGS